MALYLNVYKVQVEMALSVNKVQVWMVVLQPINWMHKLATCAAFGLSLCEMLAENSV